MSDPITDLAAELQGLRGEVMPELERVKAELGDQGTFISEIGPLVQDHVGTLDEHTRSIDLLLEEMPRQPRHPPVCWFELDADQAEAAWNGLGEWVNDILVGRYFANREGLPDCWPLHPGAVEEVTWLWTSWRHAYLPTAGAVAAAEWHTRWRGHALTGVKAAIVREAEAQAYVRCGVNTSAPDEPGTHFGESLPPIGPNPAHQGVGLPPLGAASGANGPQGAVISAELMLARRDLWWPQFVKAREADLAARSPAPAA
ncbi:hypothetical protein AB0A63_31715 [Lentzea sp. NPDC042327]|uniref:hypothetical protein n=1 Tax=Lentzea sp. NPDC042327 TaxID=3154801 RepID=UPI0033CA18F6